MSGGWYCTNCGTLYRTLCPRSRTGRSPRPGSGIISCPRCGHLGLRGYERTPRRVFCPVEDCDFTGWDDGGVNDDLGRHERREHGVDA